MKYIECETCKHNICSINRAHACLIVTSKLVEKFLYDGSKWKSISRYEYALWKPKKKYLKHMNYLDDNLFEI